MTRLGIVTGMAAEADCLGAAGDVACAGGDAARAAAAAGDLLAAGVDAMMSFGVAGGLDPLLRPGAIVVADAVVDPAGGRFETHAHWRLSLLAALAGLHPAVATVAGVDRAVADAAAKRGLRDASGAAAVDTESHAVAAAAARAGVPFMVLRVIADPARRALPWAALGGLGDDGRMRTGAVLGRLARRPWQAPGVALLALDAARAFAALRRCAAAGTPLFGSRALG